MRQPRKIVTPTLLRLDPETRELLDEFATRTGRTLTAAATLLLHDGLRQAGQLDARRDGAA